MRYRDGYLTLLVANGVAIRAHWSLPLPLLLLLSGTGAGQGVCIGWVMVVVCHELGHAAVARRFGVPVLSLDFHALGGACRYLDTGTPLQTALIAWGGVAAQAALVVAVILFDTVFPNKGDRASAATMYLILINGVIALMNLMPAPPFDGARAWRAIPLLVRASSRRSRAAPRREARGPYRRNHLRLMRRDDDDHASS